MRKIVTAMVLLSLVSSCKRTNDADQIIGAFAGSCPSYGNWTQSAIAQSRALSEVIKSVAYKDECKPLSQALIQAQNLTGMLEKLSTDPKFVAYKQNQELKKQLLLSLTKTSDTIVQTALSTRLAEVETSLAESKAESSINSEIQTHDATILKLSETASFIQVMLAQGTDTAKCLRNNPALGISVATSAAAMGTSVINPVVGAGLAAVGTILTGVINFVVQNNFEEQVQKVNDIRLPVAYSCGLEAMAETYCQASEMKDILKVHAKSYVASKNPEFEPSELWKGMHLWGKEIPVLNAWLLKVASGVSPQDTFSAAKIDQAWNQVNKVNSFKRISDGILAETKKDVDATTDLESVNKKLKAAIKSIVGIVSSGMMGGGNSNGPEHPIIKYNSVGDILMKLTGDASLGPKAAAVGAFVDPGALISDAKIIGGYSGVSIRTEELISETYKLVLATFHQNVDQDPNSLLADAFQPTLNRPAPIAIINSINEFLLKHEETLKPIAEGRVLGRTPVTKGAAEQMIKLSAETRSVLSDIILNLSNEKLSQKDRINYVFEKLNLINGNEFLSRRLYRHIKWDLNYKIKKGELPKEMNEWIITSGKDLLEESFIGATANIEYMKQDILQAQSISQGNIEVFLRTFGENINKTLQDLHGAVYRSKEEADGPNNILISKLCILTATMSPRWPSGIDPRLCKNAEIKSAFPAIKQPLKFTELYADHYKTPMKDRICKFRDFMKTNLLFQ